MKSHNRFGPSPRFLAIALALASAATGRAVETNPAPAVSYLNLPATPYHYAKVPLPATFTSTTARQLDNTPLDNPITDAGAALGRVLFYDPRLSANNTVSCSSCHQQEHAFGDPRRFSAGFNGQLTDRHSMSLVNLRYYERGRFFRDERAGTLEQQVLMPVQSPSEMGQNLPALTMMLAKDPVYPDLFRNAFGSSAITEEGISRALAQFVRSLVSNQSRYDEGRAAARTARDTFTNFTLSENRGKTLFLDDCATCHLPRGEEASFQMDAPKNNGLEASIRVVDNGVGDISLHPGDQGLFKAMSLRNIEYAGPYMHDGRLATMEAVVEHYATNFRPHPNLSRGMRRLNLTEQDKTDLVAFLKTLSDQKFISDVRFSDPFVTHPGNPGPGVVATVQRTVALRADATGGGGPSGRGGRGRPGGPGQPPPPRGGRGPNAAGGPPPPGAPGRGPNNPPIPPENVVDHVLGFAAAADTGKVTAAQLPERMGRLIPLGDLNHDGALDRAELQALVPGGQ